MTISFSWIIPIQLNKGCWTFKLIYFQKKRSPLNKIVSISCHTVLTSTFSPVSFSAVRYAILCNYQPVSISCHTVLTSTVSPVSCSAVRYAILCNHPSFYILSHCTHLHSFPSVLLSSALCSCGYWSASFRLAAWAHTIKAFIGRLTCILRLSDDALQHNIYSRVRNISLSIILNISKSTLCRKATSFCIPSPFSCKTECEMNFMIAPCISNIKHFIVQLMHTNYKILLLLK